MHSAISLRSSEIQWQGTGVMSQQFKNCSYRGSEFVSQSLYQEALKSSENKPSKYSGRQHKSSGKINDKSHWIATARATYPRSQGPERFPHLQMQVYKEENFRVFLYTQHAYT